MENSLLESALNLPRQPQYRNSFDKAGMLLQSLIRDRPFVDGNKRVGVATTWLFLGRNGHFLAPTNDEPVRFALDIASSHLVLDWREIAGWLGRIRSWSRDRTWPR
jgi:death-on-curing protein